MRTAGLPSAHANQDPAPGVGGEAADDAKKPASPGPNGHSAPSALASLLGVSGETWPGPRPFADVQAALPPHRLLRIGDQLVHVERAGRGEAVLLLHGFGCSSHSWRLMIPELARRFRVIAPDLNGFGWTQRPREAAAYTLAGQGALLEGVLRELGVTRVHLVGHSYGGGLALWLAARQPERVRSLTLVASALPEYSVEQRQAWARFRSLNWLLVHFFVLSRGAVRRALALCYHDRALVTPDAVEAYRERLLVEGVEDAYYGLLAPLDAPSPRVDLATVTAPTLVLWGDDDRIAPFAQAEPHVRRLPRARVELIPACGHAPMEEHPQETLRFLLPFLESNRDRWPERLLEALRLLGRHTTPAGTDAPRAA